MTRDIIETWEMYNVTYFGIVSVALMELDIIDVVVDRMKSDDMLEARKLMDAKIPTWK